MVNLDPTSTQRNTVQRNFGSVRAYNAYVQSGKPGITQEQMTFIHAVVQANSAVFVREMISLGSFTDALNQRGVSFLRKGENYEPLLAESVVGLTTLQANDSCSNYGYVSVTQRKWVEKLFLGDLMSPAMLFADIKMRIESGELRSPYNETK